LVQTPAVCAGNRTEVDASYTVSGSEEAARPALHIRSTDLIMIIDASGFTFASWVRLGACLREARYGRIPATTATPQSRVAQLKNPAMQRVWEVRV
jgi:hypothetical protein